MSEVTEEPQGGTPSPEGGNPSTPPQNDPNATIPRRTIMNDGTQAPPVELPATDETQPSPATPSDEEQP